jgi:DNA-binding transcriptional MocR family regulator
MDNKTDFAYQMVYRYLLRLTNEISTGPAVRLPSLRLLARRLRVSISTVQNAYSLLEREGRICSVPKSGYYALPNPCHDAPCEGDDVFTRFHAGARRTDMFIFGVDEPTLLVSLHGALLSAERDLMRHYPCPPDPQFQPFGDIELRTSLAGYYTSSTEHCWHPDNVFIGPDKTAVLKAVIKALQLRDCAVLVESPCGWGILRTLQSFGIRVIEVSADAHGGIDVEDLGAVIQREGVKMAIISSQMDPVRGQLQSREQRAQMAEVLNLHGLWVLENDCHGALCFEEGHPPFRDLIDPQRLLVLGAFDKTIGLEAPFGYLLSRHSRPLWHEQWVLRSFRLPPVRQVELYLGDEVRFLRPRGGASLWLESKHRVDTARVFNRLLEQRIVVAPGELFSARGLHQQSLRISGTVDWAQNIESMLVIVRNALGQERLG